jgi:BON domain
MIMLSHLDLSPAVHQNPFEAVSVIAALSGFDAADLEFALNRSWFDTKHIKVKAIGGYVTLSGRVATWKDWKETTKIALAYAGVTAVKNDIVIG